MNETNVDSERLTFKTGLEFMDERLACQLRLHDEAKSSTWCEWKGPPEVMLRPSVYDNPKLFSQLLVLL